MSGTFQLVGQFSESWNLQNYFKYNFLFSHDEMGFGLSYNSNTCGGRPGMQLLAKGVQNAGAPTQKSSYRCSLFCVNVIYG